MSNVATNGAQVWMHLASGSKKYTISQRWMDGAAADAKTEKEITVSGILLSTYVASETPLKNQKIRQ